MLGDLVEEFNSLVKETQVPMTKKKDHFIRNLSTPTTFKQYF